MTATSHRAALLVWLRRTGAGLTVVLLLTGLYLTANYRPLATAAWQDVDVRPDGLFWSQRVWQITHTVSAILLPVALLATIIATALEQDKFRLGRVSPPVLLLLMGISSSISGVFLPWDQLALWAVSVGQEYRGFTWLWSDQVRFVIVRGSILEPGAVQKALIVHLALGVALTGFTIAFASSARFRKTGFDEL